MSGWHHECTCLGPDDLCPVCEDYQAADPEFHFTETAPGPSDTKDN